MICRKCYAIGFDHPFYKRPTSNRFCSHPLCHLCEMDTTNTPPQHLHNGLSRHPRCQQLHCRKPYAKVSPFPSHNQSRSDGIFCTSFLQVTLWSPQWRSPNPWKGHLNHSKKNHSERPGIYNLLGFDILFAFNKQTRWEKQRQRRFRWWEFPPWTSKLQGRWTFVEAAPGEDSSEISLSDDVESVAWQVCQAIACYNTSIIY